MSNLVDIVKEDLGCVGQVIAGTAKGIYHGLITPFELYTELKQMIKLDCDDPRSVEPLTQFSVQAITAFTTGIFLYSILNDGDSKSMAVATLLIGSNAYDYISDAHNRANSIEEVTTN